MEGRPQTPASNDAEAERAEALRRLAGGVAHDLNNVLAAVIGNASLLLAALPPGDPNRERAEGVASAASRATELTRALLLYAGRAAPAVREIDLVLPLREHLAALAGAERVRLEPAAGRWVVRGDPAQIGLGVRYLVERGLAASRDGEVRVTLGSESHGVAGPPERFGQTALPPGDYVRVVVEYDGAGDDPAGVAQAFEPYAPASGGGRGPGAAPALGVARLNGGVVRATALGGGRARLELVLRAAATEARPRPRVLVVEDEAPIRDYLSAALDHLGCTAVACASGAEAVERLRQDPVPFQLVLLDLSMPGLAGADTFRELRRLAPGLRVVVCSGYEEGEARRRFGGLDWNGYLAKPFSVATLKLLVDQIG